MPVQTKSVAPRQLSVIDLLQSGLADAEATGHLVTPEQQARNASQTTWDVAGMLPVIGNLISAYEAMQGGQNTVAAAQAGDAKGTALNAGATALSVAGALSPLPWGKRAGQAVQGASSTAAAFPVYHGTPHDVDRFSLDKVGTGEGAQVYGHGLYFAAEPEVAKFYRDQLGKYVLDGQPAQGMMEGTYARRRLEGKLPDDIAFARQEIQKMLDWRHVPEANKTMPREWLQADRQHRIDYALDDLEKMERVAAAKEVSRTGNLYRAEIDAEPEDFLDLDLPLSKQSPRVQEALRKLGFEPVDYHDGHWLQSELNRRVTNEPAWMEAAEDIGPRLVSERLREAGIPGNRYGDQFTRAGSADSRNYVVFDDQIIGVPELMTYLDEWRKGGAK